MEKIKRFLESDKGKDILIVIIVILVGLGSFVLGRLSKQGTNSGIKVEYPNETLEKIQKEKSVSSVEASVISSNGKNFFASSRGSKYYPVGCSAGKSIKQENRVYFDTRESAEKAGYTMSSSCE